MLKHRCLCANLRLDAIESISDDDIIWLHEKTHKLAIERRLAITVIPDLAVYPATALPTDNPPSAVVAGGDPWLTASSRFLSEEHGAPMPMLSSNTSWVIETRQQEEHEKCLTPESSNSSTRTTPNDEITPNSEEEQVFTPLPVRSATKKRGAYFIEEDNIGAKRKRKGAPINSYPSQEITALLREHGQAWRDDPSLFLSCVSERRWSFSQAQDWQVFLYRSYQQAASSNLLLDLFQRLVCVLFRKLGGTHKNAKQEVISRIQTYEQRQTEEDNATVATTVMIMMDIGRKWMHIIGLAKEHGILFLLGEGRSWERMKACDAASALEDITKSQPQLIQDAQAYTPTVKALIQLLQNYTSFPPIVPVGDLNTAASTGNCILQAASLPRQFQNDCGITNSDLISINTNHVSLELQHWFGQMQKPNLYGVYSRDVTLLLALLAYVDGRSLSLQVLIEGTHTQNRWNEEGYVQLLSPVKTGLDPELEGFLQDVPRFHTAVDRFCAECTLFTTSGSGQERAIEISEDAQIQIKQTMNVDVANYWLCQTLVIICHAFPRRFLEHMNLPIAKLCLPHLRQLLNHLEKAGLESQLSTAIASEIAETLIAASFYRDITSTNDELAWKKHAIAKAKRLLSYQTSSWLLPAIAERKSSLWRTLGKWEKAESTVNKLMDLGHVITSQRMRASYDMLTIAKAQNLIAKDEISIALAFLTNLTTSNEIDEPRHLSHVVELLRRFHMGKALRHICDFAAAKEHLIYVWNSIESRQAFRSIRNEVLAEVVDVYCQLGELDKCQALIPAKISDMILHQDQWVGPYSKRFLLAYAECLFQSGDTFKAKEIYRKVFDSCRIAKDSSPRNLIGAMAGLARIYHEETNLNMADEQWRLMFSEHAKFYQSGGRDVSRIVLLSLADVARLNGNEGEKQRLLQVAEGLETKATNKTGSAGWILGLAPQWRSRICKSLGVKT